MRRSTWIVWCALASVFIAQSVQPQSPPGSAQRTVNGLAIRLPKPAYPKDARKYCAEGEVRVQVTFDRAGRVTHARALSGDEQLTNAGVEAAWRARFRAGRGRPEKTVGVLIYKFVSPWTCVKAGVVNARAITIPKPDSSLIGGRHFRLNKEETVVDVDIVVNPEGNVISARARAVHPLLRPPFERSAAGAKFSPINVGVYVRAVIRYVIKRNGEITY
jgi:TonB family protein